MNEMEKLNEYFGFLEQYRKIKRKRQKAINKLLLKNMKIVKVT